MPPVSRAQSRLFRAAAHGDVRLPGLSREKAQEFVAGYKTKDLPEKADGRKLQRKRQLRKGRAKPKKSVHGAYS